MVFPNKNNSKYFETVNDNKSIYIILGNLFKNFKIWGEGESFGIWIFTEEKISGGGYFRDCYFDFYGK